MQFLKNWAITISILVWFVGVVILGVVAIDLQSLVGVLLVFLLLTAGIAVIVSWPIP